VPSKVAFLDTNTFLHYPPVDQIDWRAALEADEVVLIVAPVIIRELNLRKDTPTSPKIRERAAAALRRLHNLFDSTPPIMIRDGVELQFRPQDPLIDFAEQNLSRDVSDDYLIASTLEFAQDHPGTPPFIVTEDLCLKLKSKTHGILVRQLPSTLRLPDEVDASQKRITQLEREVSRLQNRIPVLKLYFANGQDRLHLRVSPLQQLEPDAIARSMEAIRAKHPKLQTNIDVGRPVTLGEMIGITFAGIPAEHAKEYNEKLDAFYLEHEQYLVRLQDYRNLRARTAELKIMLANEGTCPADDIDIYMHFPDGFELVNGEDLDEPPKPPKSLRKPATMQELIAGAAAMPSRFRSFGDIEGRIGSRWQ